MRARNDLGAKLNELVLDQEPSHSAARVLMTHVGAALSYIFIFLFSPKHDPVSKS